MKNLNEKNNVKTDIKEKIKIELVCKKCGWKWIQKNVNKQPRSCPYCKSYNWK